MPGSLLILTGPPGAGKSTVARLVAEDAPRPTVHLHTDSFYVWIKTGFVAPYLPEAAEQNDVVLGVIAEAACGYARGGYDVVLDGVIGPWALEPFRDAAKRDDLPLFYVVLRPTLEVTLARGTAREGKELTEVEPIKGMHGAFVALGDLEANVLDTSGQTIEETADAVRRQARSATFALS
ncbi:ATP-binding protein [Amycolatopsis sp. OK19-0408]|uniref:ATP-binding protein n=1 Tax=Amycolatopsis iheyensis TaxID=2945988 RepID=A0A9X2SNQ7_9PSEU|nr:ATP-binding protein [Amycolatopsis iheyensis]MCR6488243.1 ATP-binding protein [Amycolatopsis iheyensis]